MSRIATMGRGFLSAVFMGVLGLLPFGGVRAQAQAPVAAIGYALLDEAQDAASKTYTVTFEVWSNDRDAQELAVSAKAESPDLEILTKKRHWRGRIKKQKRYKHSLSVKNSGTETRPMTIEIRRRAEKRSDSKSITVMVAPQ